MAVTTLCLVRHGQVENPRKIVYGRQPGWFLSARGQEQAEAVAQRLRSSGIAHVYTSPLERALETARIVAQACPAPLTVREDLTESSLGAHWEGLSWREVRTARRAEWEAYLHRPLDITFVDEPFAALATRMARALTNIAASHRGGAVAAVSHGDPIKAGVLALTGGHLRDLHREPVPTGGLVVLELDDDGRGRVLERWAG